jgi:hypothetical protein
LLRLIATKNRHGHAGSALAIRIPLAIRASPWGGSRMSQALDGRPFLTQTPFQKLTLKVTEFGFRRYG